MRIIGTRLVVVLFALSCCFATNPLSAREISIRHSQNATGSCALLSPDNGYSAYVFTEIVARATSDFLLGPSENSESLDLGKEALAFVARIGSASGFLYLGHETAHLCSAIENGAEFTLWSVGSNTPLLVSWAQSTTNTQRLALVTAGIRWNQETAEYAMKKSIGKKKQVADLLWILLNEHYTTWYLNDAEKPKPNTRYDFHDTKDYIRLVTDDGNPWNNNIIYFGLVSPELERRQLVHRDTQHAAIWQALGGLPLLYLFSLDMVPRLWFMNETELSPAGVLFGATGWFRLENGALIGVRGTNGNTHAPGADGKTPWTAELSLEDIPLGPATFDLVAGTGEVAGKVWSSRARVSFPLYHKLSGGFEYRTYDGYHRDIDNVFYNSGEEYKTGSFFLKYQF